VCACARAGARFLTLVASWGVRLAVARLKTLRVARRAITCADFTHNNALVLGASADNNIYVLSYAQDRIAVHCSPCSCASIACISTCSETTILLPLLFPRLFLSSFAKQNNLLGHKGPVVSAQFTFDSRQIISGSSDRCIKLWDVEKGICTRGLSCILPCSSS
jgi:WD40 repeat protein